MSGRRLEAGDNNAISTLNSMSLRDLAANELWVGEGEDVTQFGRAAFSISSSTQASGILFIEVSRDGDNWSGPPRYWKDIRFAQPHMWQIAEQFLRIKFQNGPVAVENTIIATHYSNHPNISLGHQLDEVLVDETEATVTRSVIAGIDHAGVYHNAHVDVDGRLKVETEGLLSAIDRLTVEQQLTNAYLKILTGGEVAEIKDTRHG